MTSINFNGDARYLASAYLLCSTISKRFYHYPISLRIDTHLSLLLLIFASDSHSYKCALCLRQQNEMTLSRINCDVLNYGMHGNYDSETRIIYIVFRESRLEIQLK